ncbi:hypothetical protein PPACK8108_LOCUS10087 [Phakopsora pachyrhizi]|uniref:Uncharacterized protein n=1 Tax=Phakopsora pachyrhizi TaxID=170000 RepID=A0AAV0AXP4_PHAPC|nr:hypothetical protein PPACK8108_LOCUS10087 [Phakopsora pachyrhizi]
MSAHSAAATNSRIFLPTKFSATLKFLKCSESAVGFQAVTFIVCIKIHRFRFECHPNDADRPVLKDETNHTVDDPQNIANSVCSASQRATKSDGISTPTYYANLVATRDKKWDISDENGSTVFHNQQWNSKLSAPDDRAGKLFSATVRLIVFRNEHWLKQLQRLNHEEIDNLHPSDPPGTTQFAGWSCGHTGPFQVIVYIRYTIQQSGQDLQKFLLWIMFKQVVPPGSGSILIQRNTMFLIHLFHQQLSGSSVVFQRSSCIDSKALVLNIVTVIDRFEFDELMSDWPVGLRVMTDVLGCGSPDLKVSFEDVEVLKTNMVFFVPISWLNKNPLVHGSRENLDTCSCKLCTDLVKPMCNHARCNTHKILSFRGLLARLVPETGVGKMMRDLLAQKGDPGGNRLSRNGCGNGRDRYTRFSQDVILSEDAACGCEQTGCSLL